MPTAESATRGRERILQAALSEFAVGGFDRVTTRDIGRAAGVSSPALYRHYCSKHELGVDLYRRCYAKMIDAARQAEKASTALAKLQSYVAEQVFLFEREPLVILYVDEHQHRFWPLVSAEFEPATMSGIVMQWVAQGRKDGSLSITEDIAAQTALVLGLASQWVAMSRQGLVRADAAKDLALLIGRALERV